MTTRRVIILAAIVGLFGGLLVYLTGLASDDRADRTDQRVDRALEEAVRRRTLDLRAGCERSNADRRATQQLDRGFRRLALTARDRARRVGDDDFAGTYQELADEAVTRIDRRRDRIVDCRSAFPQRAPSRP